MSTSRLSELIERLGGVLRARARRRGAELGLQPVHLQVLDYLARCNRFSNTPAALTAYLQATKGTVSQSLKLLEGRGLVSRQTDREDRRVVRLALTDAGREALAAGAAGAGLAAYVTGLKPAEVAATEAVLEACLREMQRQQGFDGFGQCRSCRWLERPAGDGYRCGLTGEPLQEVDTLKLCQEHRWPESSATASRSLPLEAGQVFPRS
jgi:MarR family transcriptional repressor of emrRAB